MDDVVPKTLRTFDAFPKVSSTYSVKSSRGGAVTIVLSIVCLFWVWIQLAEYIGGFEEQKFSVDDQVAQSMQINLDITVNMACDLITINAFDASEDRLLVNELLQFQSVDLSLKNGHLINEVQKEDSFHDIFKRARKSKFPKRKTAKDPEHSSCRIYGSFPVNKVRGDLQIAPRVHRVSLHELEERMNFTHYIDEFSFGEYYPKLVNPLDGVIAIAKEHLDVYQYFLSVVPTTYKSYSTGNTIQTNQYAVTEREGRMNYRQGLPPGIIFKYDIEPIALTISDRRLPFSQFLVRIINVLGGLVVCTSWLYSVVDRFFHKPNEGNNRGVLDTPVDEILNEKSSNGSSRF